MGDVAGVSSVYSASNFRAKVCKVGKFPFMYECKLLYRREKTSSDREEVGAAPVSTGPVDRKSCASGYGKRERERERRRRKLGG
jgi:hypothetical protein